MNKVTMGGPMSGACVAANEPTVQGRMIEEAEALNNLATLAETIADDLCHEPNSPGEDCARPFPSTGQVDAMFAHMATINIQRNRLGVALERIKKQLSRV